MARIYEPDDEEIAAWNLWIAARPPVVRAVAERFDPWSLYRLKDTGQLVTLVGFDEMRDGSVTMKIAVSGRFNLVPFDTGVFGIKPEDLEPAELPGPDVPVGEMLTNKVDQQRYIEMMREAMFGPSKRKQ